MCRDIWRQLAIFEFGPQRRPSLLNLNNAARIKRILENRGRGNGVCTLLAGRIWVPSENFG